VEKVRQGSSAVFAFNASIGKSVMIELTPYEGDANLYATAGPLRENTVNFEYSATSKAKKIIVIPSSHLLFLPRIGSSTRNIFIRVDSHSDCLFLIKAQMTEESIIDISPGVVEVGTVTYDTFVNRTLHFKHESNSLHNIEVRLNSEATLYVKACQASSESCVIGKSRKDIVQYDFDSPEYFKDKKFLPVAIHSNTKRFEKYINFTLVCANKTAVEQGNNLTGATNQLVLYSDICAVAIGVGIQDRTIIEKEVKYELHIEEERSNQLLIANHFVRSR